MAACCAGSVSGAGLTLLLPEILCDIFGSFPDCTPRVGGFCAVSVLDAADKGADCVQEVRFVQCCQVNLFRTKLSEDAGLGDGDARTVLEAIARRRLCVHFVVCVVCWARVVVSLA